MPQLTPDPAGEKQKAKVPKRKNGAQDEIEPVTLRFSVQAKSLISSMRVTALTKPFIHQRLAFVTTFARMQMHECARRPRT